MKLFQEMVFTSFLCGGLILLICAVNKAVGHRYQRKEVLSLDFDWYPPADSV